MKVLLVKPFSEYCEAAPPLGLMYISSYLKNNLPGTSVRIMDMRLLRRGFLEYTRLLKDWKPDIVGIQVLSSDVSVAGELSNIAKRINPEVHISCGGVEPSQSHEDFVPLKNIDSIVAGEGEFVFLNLVESISKGVLLVSEKTRGISFRREDGSLESAEKSEPIQDLDLLPFPDWDSIDIGAYSRVPQFNGMLAGRRYMPVFTSRGCPYGCTFCHRLFGRRPRLRSPENVFDEISTLVRDYGVDEIQVFDDTFNVSRKRLIEICDLISAADLGIKISFPNAVRGDLLDEETILKLKEAGMYNLTVAIESSSPRIQKMINKNLDVDRAREAVDIAYRNGILTSAFFLIGFPGETVEEINGTIDLAMKMPLDLASISILTPFKGTEMYEIASRDIGKEKLDAISKHYFAATSSSYYSVSTGVDIQRIQRNAYIRFYLSPFRLAKRFIRMPRKLRYLFQFKAQIMNHVRFLLQKFFRRNQLAPRDF